MKVSIIGVTGYSGLELVRLLSSHSQAELVSVHATKAVGLSLSDIYPHLKGSCDLIIEAVDPMIIMQKSDLVFMATPSGVAKELSQTFIDENFPVIDLSGDHRLSGDLYQRWYGKQPAADTILEAFHYSLAEFSQEPRRFISNPGCYATATELALIPLMMTDWIDADSIIVDAKSGLTGAGKSLSESSHFVNVHDNYVTYKLNQHQHIPEIIQMLRRFKPDLDHIQFSTSLLPINRGIVVTAYAKVVEDLSQEDLLALYQRVYEDKFFVRIQPELPNLHNVVGSNFTDISLVYNPVTKIVTVVAVLDNLIKGAAGQAIQNMNLAFGFHESEGLIAGPQYL